MNAPNREHAPEPGAMVMDSAGWVGRVNDDETVSITPYGPVDDDLVLAWDDLRFPVARVVWQPAPKRITVHTTDATEPSHVHLGPDGLPDVEWAGPATSTRQQAFRDAVQVTPSPREAIEQGIAYVKRNYGAGAVLPDASLGQDQLVATLRSRAEGHAFTDLSSRVALATEIAALYQLVLDVHAKPNPSTVEMRSAATAAQTAGQLERALAGTLSPADSTRRVLELLATHHFAPGATS